jgi:hypothetical protein
MVDEIVTIGQENFPRVFLFRGTIVRAKAAGAEVPFGFLSKKETSPKGGFSNELSVAIRKAFIQ